MSKTSKIVLWLVGIMVLSFLIAGIAFASTNGFKNALKGEKTTTTIEEKETFSVSNIEAIDIETVSSDVNIIPVTDSDEVVVHYQGQITKFIGSSEYTFKAEMNDNQLIVDVEKKSWGIGVIYSNLKLDVYIPTSYTKDLDVTTVSGDLNIENFNLESIDLNTTSGDLDLEHITANSVAKMNTVSGNIDLSDFSGDLDLNTTSGDIEVIYTDFSNDIDADTVSGDITITLPEGSEFDLDMDTVSGDTDNELGFEPTSDNKIDIQTVSGDLTLQK